MLTYADVCLIRQHPHVEQHVVLKEQVLQDICIIYIHTHTHSHTHTLTHIYADGLHHVKERSNYVREKNSCVREMLTYADVC